MSDNVFYTVGPNWNNLVFLRKYLKKLEGRINGNHHFGRFKRSAVYEKGEFVHIKDTDIVLMIKNRIKELNQTNMIVFIHGLSKSKRLKRFKNSWMFDKNVLGIIYKFLDNNQA